MSRLPPRLDDKRDMLFRVVDKQEWRDWGRNLDDSHLTCESMNGAVIIRVHPNADWYRQNNLQPDWLDADLLVVGPANNVSMGRFPNAWSDTDLWGGKAAALRISVRPATAFDVLRDRKRCGQYLDCNQK